MAPIPPTTTDGDLSTGSLSQSAARRLAEILLIVLVFFSLTGDPPPNVNEAHYLCRLKHFWNPAWCSGDLFLESKDTQLLFIWIFGWVTRWLSLAATAWVGRFIEWTLLAWAWQRLSWRLVPRPLVSVLSAALFATFNEHLHLAGEWVIGGVEAKCFAYVFVLLALRAVVDRRWNIAWLLLGAATAFHPIVGGWSGVICAGVWAWNDRREVAWHSMLPGLVGGAVISLPGVVPALLLTWNEPPELVAEANRIYVFDRLPHHLAPLTLAGAEISRRVIGHAGLLLLLVVFASWLNRLTFQQAQGGGRDALCVSANGLKRINQFAWGAVLIALIGFAIELALWNQPLVAAKVLRYYWFRLTDFAVPMAAALHATALAAAGLQVRRAWAGWLLGILLLATGWNIAHSTWDRAQFPVPPADQKLRDFDAWTDACKWAGENTPEGSLFLTPRLNLTFKWFSGRPEVANRKDLPQDARSIVEWNRRIQDIYHATIEGQIQPLDSLGVLGTERVRELALKHGASYVLMDRGQLLKLPIVYRNAEYVIYRIDP